VKVVDANVLLYAVNEDDPKHEASRTWLDGALSATETIGLSWLSLLAFLRLATKVGVFPQPLTTGDALQQVQDWLAASPVVVATPTSRHPEILTSLLEAVGSGGNLVNDAHLAALAIELNAEVVTWDNDFDRFEGVHWTTPG
jgi:hypothetical protein